MKRAENIIHTWNKPKAAAEYEAKLVLRRVKTSIPIILIITIVLTIIFWVLIERLKNSIEIPNFNKAFSIFIVGSFILVSLCYLLQWFSSKCSHTQYSISQEGVCINPSSSNRRFYEWDKIDCYLPINKDTIPETKSIGLRLKKERMCILYLPDTELANEVIQTLENKLPICQADSRYDSLFRLTAYQWIFMFVLSCLYYVFFAYLIISKNLPKNFIDPFLIFILFFLGPGTLGFLFLFGIKFWKNKQMFLIAYIINLLSLAIAMAIFSIIGLIYLINIVEQAKAGG